MYLKPVLIALGLAVAFVVGVYLYGSHISDKLLSPFDPKPTSKPYTQGIKSDKGGVKPSTHSEVELPTITNPSTDISSYSEVEDDTVSDSEVSQPLPDSSETVSSETSNRISQIRLNMRDAHKSVVDFFQYRPKREDFDSRSDYLDALTVYHESLELLLDSSKKTDLAFFKTLSPLKLADGIAEARRLTLEEYPEDIESFDQAIIELLKEIPK